MTVKTLADLETVFRRKVIPLLQEYFYEDWQKIAAALNDPDGTWFLRIEELQPPTLAGLSDGFEESRRRYIVRESFTPTRFAISSWRYHHAPSS